MISTLAHDLSRRERALNSEHPSRVVGPSNSSVTNLAAAQKGKKPVQTDTNDVEMPDTEPEGGRRPYRVKCKEPDLYYGERPKLKGWLQQVKKWFIFNPVPEDEKAIAASTYLRGPAAEWFSPHMDDYDEDTKTTCYLPLRIGETSRRKSSDSSPYPMRPRMRGESYKP